MASDRYIVEIRIFLTVFIVYLMHLAPVPEANENRYLDLIQSIADEGRFEIDSYHYNTIDKSYFDGHYYAGAAPGPAILGVIPYVLIRPLVSGSPSSSFGQYDKDNYLRNYLKAGDVPPEFVHAYPFGRFVLLHLMLTGMVISLLTALAAALLYRCAMELGAQSQMAIVIGLAFAFGTLSFFHGTRFYSHNVSSFFLVWCLQYTKPWIDREPAGRRPLGTGILLSSAVAMDFNIGPIVALIGISLFIRYGNVSKCYLAGGMAIPAILVAVYQYLCFDSPFTTPYSLPSNADGFGVHAEQLTGFMGFVLPPISRVWDLTFGLYRGAFTYMPILMPGIVGACYGYFRDEKARVLFWRLTAGVCILQFVVVSMMGGYWYAGWGFGPRYLIPIIPFALLGLVFYRNRRLVQLIISLTVVSIVINWCGVQYGPSDSITSVLSIFLMSGITTPLHSFVGRYLSEYTTMTIGVSAAGAWLLVLIVVGAIWRKPLLNRWYV